MHSTTAIIAAYSLFAVFVSGSPLFIRANTCGAAPNGNTNNQPINQPSGIQTAVDCQDQCNANASCQSFCFGLIDTAIQCKLFSCAASAIPTQGTNLIAYDKGCSAVPSVVPTSSNPTGKAQGTTEKPQPQGTNGQPQGSNGQATNPQKQQPRQAPATKATPTANTCGAKPAGSANNQPIAVPSVSSVDLCKAQCAANPNCKSFTFGNVNNAMVCQLYAVAASAIPVPADAAQKSALVAYDIGCPL